MPEFPFTTDGCSGAFMRLVRLYWRLTGQHELTVQVTACCVKHDRAYWAGGTAAERVAADAELARGVAALGQPLLARLMFIGVSVGGHWILPFSWRWGYGYRWPLPYRPRT